MKNSKIVWAVISGLLASASAGANDTYLGSTFNEVRDVILDRGTPPSNPDERAEWHVYQAGKLPRYEVKESSFVESGIDVLFNSAVRTTTQRNDFYPRLKKLLHPNGACVTGIWEITEASPYSGYFAAGKKGLFIGRVSVAMNETTASKKRGFGFAGKIFPTLNPEERVKTANFFTVDVLMGTKAPHFTDVALTNEPELGFDLSLIGIGLKIANTLKRADQNPNFRPLYPIAELGLDESAGARTPHWMKIETAPGQPKIDELDFRDEVNLSRHYPNGLRLLISVSDTTKDTKSPEWKRIGHIDLKESAVSYGCDRQLHFAHPKLK